MNKRSMRILGFYQVQNLLVRLAPSRLSKEIARRLRPVNDGDVIEKNLTDTEEAVRCMQTETSTPFGGIVDIRPSLEKAKREVTLDSHECIDIWNNLQHYGEIRSFFAERGAEYPQLAEQAEVIGDFPAFSFFRHCLRQQPPDPGQCVAGIDAPAQPYRRTGTADQALCQ